MHHKGRGREKDDVGLWVFWVENLNTESNCCVSPWGVNLRKLSNFSSKFKRNCSSFVVGHVLRTWCVLMTLRADWVILGKDVFWRNEIKLAGTWIISGVIKYKFYGYCVEIWVDEKRYFVYNILIQNLIIHRGFENNHLFRETNWSV